MKSSLLSALVFRRPIVGIAVITGIFLPAIRGVAGLRVTGFEIVCYPTRDLAATSEG